MPLLAKNKTKIDPSRLRVEKVVVQASKPKPKPQPLKSGSSKPSRPSPISQSLRAKSASPYPSSSDDRRLDRKRKAGPAPPRKSPASDRIAFDKDSESDNDEDWVSALDARKRLRRALDDGRLVDENRSLRQVKSFAEPTNELRLINAADVASLKLASLKDKCKPVLGANEDEVEVQLQYPSKHKQERYLVMPSKDITLGKGNALTWFRGTS
jgi:[histone H3]-lysine79 N-trimethyltransferase